MKIILVILGIAITLAIMTLEKEYVKKYKLYGAVIITYIITVYVIYIGIANLFNRNIHNEFL